MSDSSTSASALIICATRAASRSLSPNRISDVATVSFSLMTGMAASASNCSRGARVQMAAALLGVFRREQDLCDADAVAGQGLVPGMGEADLARCRGGLFFLEAQIGALEAELAAAQRHRAGRDDQHLLPARAGCGDILAER